MSEDRQEFYEPSFGPVKRPFAERYFWAPIVASLVFIIIFGGAMYLGDKEDERRYRLQESICHGLNGQVVGELCLDRDTNARIGELEEFTR